MTDTQRVIARDESKPTGAVTGITKDCEIEDCPGEVLEVKWDDGEVTWSCSRGMDLDGDVWTIL